MARRTAPMVLDAQSFEERALRRLSERQWQEEHVIGTRTRPGYLPLHGYDLIYHTWNSQHSAKGFPDLVAARLRDGCITLLFAELKRWNAEPTTEQLRWLQRLDRAARVVNLMCAGKVRLVVGWYTPLDRDRFLEEIR